MLALFGRSTLCTYGKLGLCLYVFLWKLCLGCPLAFECQWLSSESLEGYQIWDLTRCMARGHRRLPSVNILRSCGWLYCVPSQRGWRTGPTVGDPRRRLSSGYASDVDAIFRSSQWFYPVWLSRGILWSRLCPSVLWSLVIWRLILYQL